MIHTECNGDAKAMRTLFILTSVFVTLTWHNISEKWPGAGTIFHSQPY